MPLRRSIKITSTHEDGSVRRVKRSRPWGCSPSSRATAETYWPGTNPVGKRIQATSQEVRLGAPWLLIIGVVEDIRQYGFASDARHRAPFVVRLEAQPPADRVRSWGSTPTSRPWPHSLKARCNT